MQTSPPEEQIYGQNSNFYSFGAVFPPFCPDKREIWHAGAERGPLPRANFHVYRTWRGEKPIFGPLTE